MSIVHEKRASATLIRALNFIVANIYQTPTIVTGEGRK